MSSSRFKAAQRAKSKLRMAIDGPSGSGKSYTALRFAFALAKSLGNGRVAAIDTEHGSLSKYAGEAPDGIPFEFDVLELANFSPTEYTAAIDEAGRAGYDALVIDSLSHAWQGKDGALELVSKKGGNSFTAWKDVTPMHQRMIEAMVRSPLHIIVTMRSKTEYVIETNDKGKSEPRRVGVKPIQREGMEYEFDVYGSMDWSHVLTISKSRCSFLQDAITVKPGAIFVQPLVEWLETGVQKTPVELKRMIVGDDQVKRIVGLVTTLGRVPEKEKKEMFRRYMVEDVARLTPEQANDYEARLRAAMEKKKAVAESAESQEASPPVNGHPQPASSIPAGVDPASGKTQAPDAAPPPKEPREPKTLTDGSWRELLQLRGSWAAAKGIAQDDGAGIAAAWKTVLTKHGVETAKALDFDGYWRLRRELEAEVEAFEKAELAKKHAQIEKEAGPNDAGETFQDALLDATGLDPNTGLPATGRPAARASA